MLINDEKDHFNALKHFKKFMNLNKNPKSNQSNHQLIKT